MKTQNAKEQFIAIYNAEADSVFRFCLVRTSDREIALDLSQETFLRFWDVLSEKNSQIQNERALLFKIARNLIIDWYRKKKTISIEAMVETDGDVEILFGVVGRETMEIESDGKRFIDKIKELDLIYQQPIYLRFVEDMKPKEIAEVLGESANVISVRIDRGLKQLRKSLENENYGK